MVVVVVVVVVVAAAAVVVVVVVVALVSVGPRFSGGFGFGFAPNRHYDFDSLYLE